jgi:hypothetical protein
MSSAFVDGDGFSFALLDSTVPSKSHQEEGKFQKVELKILGQ